MQSSIKDWKEQHNNLMFIFIIILITKIQKAGKQIEVTSYFSKHNDSHLQLHLQYKIRIMQSS